MIGCVLLPLDVPATAELDASFVLPVAPSVAEVLVAVAPSVFDSEMALGAVVVGAGALVAGAGALPADALAGGLDG